MTICLNVFDVKLLTSKLVGLRRGRREERVERERMKQEDSIPSEVQPVD
jgi:hypothetical protein